MSAESVGSYSPMVSSMNDPDTPGRTRAETATAAASTMTAGVGVSWVGGTPVSRKTAAAAIAAAAT